MHCARLGVRCETRRVRNWMMASTCLAPAALIGGWTVAASRQPRGYSALRDTISALAARGATDRWIMTSGLTVLGVSYLVSAAALRELATAARALLAAGGLATIAVAALPQPNVAHAPAATVGFVALALWPACGRAQLHRVGVAISVCLVAELFWLAFELDAGGLVGLSERLASGSEAVIPLAFVALHSRKHLGSARLAHT